MRDERQRQRISLPCAGIGAIGGGHGEHAALHGEPHRLTHLKPEGTQHRLRQRQQGPIALQRGALAEHLSIAVAGGFHGGR